MRYLGTFLTDPLDVPPLVTEHLAGQLGIGDPGCVARYAGWTCNGTGTHVKPVRGMQAGAREACLAFGGTGLS